MMDTVAFGLVWSAAGQQQATLLYGFRPAGDHRPGGAVAAGAEAGGCGTARHA
jgi:hypothetical protein